MSVRAGIVVTGTEVLTGRTSDRNGPWVSERLGELGVEVAHLTVVGDRPEDLRGALDFLAGQGADLIVTTGGLGPTADDLTTQIVAEFAGVELELDSGMEARITAIIEEFAKRMKFDPEGVKAGTRKQAMIPAGSTPLDPIGTAPGVVVRAGDSVVMVLPGPPRELQGMWPAALAAPEAAALLERTPDLRTATMKMFGVPESTLAMSLREIEETVDLGRLEITTCLRRGAELEIDVIYTDGDEQLLRGLFDGLRERHESFIYTESGETIDELVAAALEGRTLAVAESCTAGLLAARLTDRPGSSDYFAGGVVAYSNEAKAELLGVDPALIEAEGAVSPGVAAAMADGALERFGADVGVGITGVAGPDGGTDEKPVGYVCICARTADGRELARDPKLPGGRGDVRDRSVSVSLHMLRRLLLGGELPL
ncbi:MAG TPA: competence/damage-inducible protein A [Solirubrobacterales bacterium]|nr:competence/damage-inducible protein A [Solirubrobacterales bacterium]